MQTVCLISLSMPGISRCTKALGIHSLYWRFVMKGSHVVVVQGEHMHICLRPTFPSPAGLSGRSLALCESLASRNEQRKVHRRATFTTAITASLPLLFSRASTVLHISRRSHNLSATFPIPYKTEPDRPKAPALPLSRSHCTFSSDLGYPPSRIGGSIELNTLIAREGAERLT